MVVVAEFVKKRSYSTGANSMEFPQKTKNGTAS